LAAVDPTNTNTALASALCEELSRCGVERAVICPGSRSTPVALALLREPGIETVSVVDERSGGFLALGAAAASGLPVAIVCTSGTASANLHPAVAEAAESSLPLIVLTGDRPAELRGIGAGQTIDQIGLYGSAVRWFCEVGTHAADDAGLLHMRSTACRAFAAAAGDSRPGPVHLNLSWRDPLGPEPVPGAVTATSTLALEGRGSLPLTASGGGLPSARPDELDALASAIEQADRGLILAGRQGDPGIAAAVAELAGRTGFPILAEPTSQVRCGPHDRSLVVSAYDQIAKSAPVQLAPEVVIRFGEMPTSKPLRAWLAASDPIQIVVDPVGAWNEPSRKAGLVLRALPADVCSGVLERLDGRGPDRTYAERWLAADGAVAGAAGDALAGRAELTEPGLQHELAGAYADGDLIFTASSMPIRDQEAFLPSLGRNLVFLSNRGANGIDGTISSAVGAAIASGRPTWVVLGDLALHHDSNGLAAVRHSSVPVRIVVVDNDGGGIFEFLPQAGQVPREEFEAAFGTPLGLDAARYAALYDLPFTELTASGGLDELPPGSRIVRLRTDRASNRALHRELDSLAADALAGALSGGASSSAS
jgi:2-succinyl-5-enolpyruvyl-6-hydroxy-3-cyclohexene-1-carboxylate synthase